MSPRRMESKLRISEAKLEKVDCGIEPTGTRSIWTCAKEAKAWFTSSPTLILFDMGASDTLIGGAMLLAASVVFVYYTTWALFLPFFDTSSQIHDLFPPREWAVRLPAFILVVGLSGIGFFVGNTILKEQRKAAQKARLRTA
ncbi:hypothetical protein D9758_003323 [Tetrapyrgos nigripes]|uniref:Dolichol phosphate-mannose biosynthesis regulatory protein n=1 Tax=Tetrapyrgos nigripes TaxID=182062 RepID=A0A8H5LQC8_9AGAR|nr:hypothetical protein D9758_003323 [Tetrapyrgos nigripes]